MSKVPAVAPYQYSQLFPLQSSPFVRYKHSSADDITAGHRGTCDNRSVVTASAGSRTRVQQALDASSQQPRPWSGLGVTLVNLPSRVEFKDDALKTGRVTGALVQCPKLSQ